MAEIEGNDLEGFFETLGTIEGKIIDLKEQGVESLTALTDDGEKFIALHSETPQPEFIVTAMQKSGAIGMKFGREADDQRKLIVEALELVRARLNKHMLVGVTQTSTRKPRLDANGNPLPRESKTFADLIGDAEDSQVAAEGILRRNMKCDGIGEIASDRYKVGTYDHVKGRMAGSAVKSVDENGNVQYFEERHGNTPGSLAWKLKLDLGLVKAPVKKVAPVITA